MKILYLVFLLIAYIPAFAAVAYEEKKPPITLREYMEKHDLKKDDPTLLCSCGGCSYPVDECICPFAEALREKLGILKKPEGIEI